MEKKRRLFCNCGGRIWQAVSKETRVDIFVTPGVTLLAGGLTFIGPVVKLLMGGIGLIIMKATKLQPFFMGMIVSVIVGLVLTSPLFSTALCIMLNLSGISAGAVAVGCCAQMVGFAATGYRDCSSLKVLETKWCIDAL